MTFIIIPNTGRPTQTDTLTPAHYAAADAGECAIIRMWWSFKLLYVQGKQWTQVCEFYDSGQWLDVPQCELERLKV